MKVTINAGMSTTRRGKSYRNVIGLNKVHRYHDTNSSALYRENRMWLNAANHMRERRWFYSAQAARRGETRVGDCYGVIEHGE